MRGFIKDILKKTSFGTFSWFILLGIWVAIVHYSTKPKLATKWNLSKEEHAWMERFFCHFMLEQTAIYTLAGSKPMTTFPLCYPALTDPYESLELEDLWDRWEKVQVRFPINKNFLLIKKEWKGDWKSLFPEFRDLFEVYLIDVYKTAFIIQENYELFKEAAGYDFDPLQIVLDFEKDPQQFWSKISTPKYSHLWGLLYGFGKENALYYFWRFKDMQYIENNEKAIEFATQVQKWPSNKDCKSIGFLDAPSDLNFTIPIFSSFSKDDPIVKKYEIERENIKKLYHGRDFVDLTLELLCETGNSNPF